MKSLDFFKPTLATTLAIVLAWLVSARPAQAGYAVTLEQVGPDVVATGSGAIDLNGLSYFSNEADVAEIYPNVAAIITGPTIQGLDSYYVGFIGPMSFGSGLNTVANSGSGDRVGIHRGLFRALVVPVGYASGTALSNTNTWNNATFNSLGVTPGTYEWTWGNGANQNFTLQVGPAAPTPTPTPTPAFFTGEVPFGNGVYYLQFPNGTPFGYYAYLTDPRWIYHFDMGYEYWFDANDGHNGIYFYDFLSTHFFYTSPSFAFPYLYDFSLNTLLYYYPDPNNPGHYTSNPRYFYNFATGQIITM